MDKIVQFGEDVPGYNIRVLNEREIRAAAGILLLATYTSLMFIIFKGNFLPIKYVISIFLLDFIIRVFISPRFSPTLIIGRLIVRNQTPEYVGAVQKRFAWSIGLVLSAAMFVFFIFVNAYSIFTGLICLICLLFLLFESAFGICLGCKVYPWFFKDKVQYCPGEVCDVKNKQAIQKTSPSQWLFLLAFAGIVTLSVFLFNNYLKEAPHPLFGEPAPRQVQH